MPYSMASHHLLSSKPPATSQNSLVQDNLKCRATIISHIKSPITITRWQIWPLAYQDNDLEGRNFHQNLHFTCQDNSVSKSIKLTHSHPRDVQPLRPFNKVVRQGGSDLEVRQVDPERVLCKRKQVGFVVDSLGRLR
jgi:hypothetical protein